MELFKGNALKAVRSYAQRYFTAKSEFDEAYQTLLQERQLLNKWVTEDANQSIGSRIEIMREKKQIIGVLFRLRKNLFLFERIYFRLEELGGYFDQGYGRGQVEAGLSAAQFFNKFNRDKRELGLKMSKVRYIMKLYAKRNNGAFPTDLLEQGEGDFFGDDDDSFFDSKDDGFDF